jgi:hypothetical protein
VHCYSETGEPLWQFDDSGKHLAALVAAPNGSTYVWLHVTAGGTVQEAAMLALDSGGGELWRADEGTARLNWPLTNPESDLVYQRGIGSASILIALAADGSPDWEFPGAVSRPTSGPDGRVYAALWDNSDIVALDNDGTAEYPYGGPPDLGAAPLWSLAIGNDSSAYYGAVHCARMGGATYYAAVGWPYSVPPVGDTAGNYYSATEGQLFKLDFDGNLAWQKGSIYPARGGPAIGTDGTVYVADDDLVALTPDLTEIWRAELPGNAGTQLGYYVDATPLLDSNGSLYVATHQLLNFFDAAPSQLTSHLTCVSSAGSERWSTPLLGEWISAPVMDSDGNLYVGSMPEPHGFDPRPVFLVALNCAGSEKWRLELGEGLISQPAVLLDDAGDLILFRSDKLYAVRPDQSEAWDYAPPGGFGGPVIGADNSILLNVGDALIALDSAGDELWSYPVPAGFALQPSVGPDGQICFRTADDHIIILDEDGNLLDEAPLGIELGFTGSRPTVDGAGKIYLVTEHWLQCLNPDGSELWRLWRYVNGRADCSPVLGADGRLYFLQINGDLLLVKE